MPKLFFFRVCNSLFRTFIHFWNDRKKQVITFAYWESEWIYEDEEKNTVDVCDFITQKVVIAELSVGSSNQRSYHDYIVFPNFGEMSFIHNSAARDSIHGNFHLVNQLKI